MEKTPTKTQWLALNLSQIMTQHGIPNTEYAIIAGYGLKDFREVTDLDVILSQEAYEKLKQNMSINGIKIGTATISGGEKLYFEVAKNLEIEFFEREHTGFPSKNFSLRNMQKTEALTKDEFNNPYIKPETVIEYYKTVSNNKKIWNGGHEISRERLEKNIKHLKLLQEKYCFADPSIKQHLDTIIENMQQI